MRRERKVIRVLILRVAKTSPPLRISYPIPFPPSPRLPRLWHRKREEESRSRNRTTYFRNPKRDRENLLIHWCPHQLSRLIHQLLLLLLLPLPFHTIPRFLPSFLYILHRKLTLKISQEAEWMTLCLMMTEGKGGEKEELEIGERRCGGVLLARRN